MENYDENPTIRLYGEPEKPPVEGNPFTIRTEVGDNTYEQVKNPNYVNPKPSDEELSMFEEWKGIEGNIKAQLGYFEPDEIPSKISSDWEAEYQKRTGLRWGLMESYATKQERQDQKAFMINRASMYKNKLSSIKSDLSAARTMWKSDRMRKLKEDQLRLKKQQEIEANPILNLYTKAKAGDMEAWNQLHQMQREAEKQQALKEKYKAAKEAAKPKKMTEADKFISAEMKIELNALKDKIKKEFDETKATAFKDEYTNKRADYLKWLQGFEGTPNEEEAPTKKLDTKKAASYLKTAKGDREAAKLLAIQDGYDVEE
jgi:ribosomal protein L19E